MAAPFFPSAPFRETVVTRWARRFAGIQSPHGFMATPPTFSISAGASSTINANTGGTVSHPFTLPAFSYGLDPAPATAFVASSPITETNAAKRTTGLGRVRFQTDAPAFEVCIRSLFNINSDINLIVDGQMAYSSRPYCLPYIATPRYVKYSFGADTQTLELMYGDVPTSGGTGYVVGDIITLAGGTFTTAAQLMVTNVTAGVVTTTLPITRGIYTAVPASPVAQGSTTGTGTGYSLSNPIWGSIQTSRKMRKIEIHMMAGIAIGGINIDTPSSILLPWAVPATQPRLVFLGDSQMFGSYLQHASAGMPIRIAKALGLDASFASNTVSGTGWTTNNGTAAMWSNPVRLADIVALAPDIVVITGSQNDTDNSALQTAVTTSLISLCASLPNAKFIGIGPVSGGASPFLAAGWAAAPQTQCAYIDMNGAGWMAGTGRVTSQIGNGPRDFYLASDGGHLDNGGRDRFADIAAVEIARAVVSLAA